jgi:chorismate mutase/prephenate dehydratase
LLRLPLGKSYFEAICSQIFDREKLMKTLEALRQTIDQIDDQLVELLNQRMEVVRQVGELKRTNNAIIYRPEREKDIIDRLSGKLTANAPLNRAAIEAVFLEIFAASRNLELPEKVAYLGPEGSYTHQAAESRFGVMSQYLPLPSIKSVFENVVTERVRFGVIPIENNQAGVVAESLDALMEHDVKIVAEILLPIHHTFASRYDNLKDIRYIFSKDQGFLQCQKFLEEYFPQANAELVPVESTSKAAQLAMERDNSAAICAAIGAKLYQLPILFYNIEDSPNNRTRFLILSKDFNNQPSGQDKTTIVAQLPDQPGSLASFLSEFDKARINLSKIESRPAREQHKFNSRFYIEIDGHAEQDNLKDILTRYAANIRCLGSYVKLC